MLNNLRKPKIIFFFQNFKNKTTTKNKQTNRQGVFPYHQT